MEIDSYRRSVRAVISCAVICGFGCIAVPATASAQSTSPATAEALPADVFADSRNRLPLLKRDGLDPQGLELYDAIAGDSRLLTGFQGPGGIRMHSPQVGQLVRRLNTYLRFESTLGARTVELAILVTARELDSQFEWSAHAPAALRAGVSQELVELIRVRGPVSGLPEPDAAVIDLGREVLGMRRVTSATYARALKAFGPKNLVDLAILIGEYSATAVLLATFDQQLPVGQRPSLPPR